METSDLPPGKTAGHIKILHVEDDDVIHMGVLRHIEAGCLPYLVDRAATFAQAAGKSANGNYDVVLLDHLLPDGTGLELLGAFNGAPVIFLTGMDNANVAVEAMKRGACEYLIKDRGFGFLEMLPVAIEKALARGRLEREHKLATEWLARQNTELARLREEMEHLALHDPLTHLANRRLLHAELKRHTASAARYRTPLSAIMIDIDHFKIFNDTNGHVAGDGALTGVAATIAAETREADLAGRYGGEEFLVLLPNTDLNEAAVLAERIRNAVKKAGTVTVSLGVACSHGESGEEIVKRADAALYRAKKSGRDRVVVDFGERTADV